MKFGTGGLRGIMGDGPGLMNVATIHLATEGLASTLPSHHKARGVVIGYDSRHNSKLFAEEAARVLAANQIPVFLSLELSPTPFISFACRHLKAAAAIMITASHNPKEYNGYKVFWEDGAQILPPHDINIARKMETLTLPISTAPLSSPLIQPIPPSVEAAYLATLPFRSNGSLRITYSSLHGTGMTLLPKALATCGFSPPHLVPLQCIPDGNFPTTPSPNPESPAALEKGIEHLIATQSDILLVSDPDADRIGVVILHHGKPVILNGHQLAALGTYYLSQKAPPGKLILTTLVTTRLIDSIASTYNMQVIRTLTGFKYIADQIRLHEDTFLFGAEESNGYLTGTECRDKDGISSACLFAALAEELKIQGKTCLDLLHDIYAQFGIFQETTLSLDLPLEDIASLMHSLRSSPPSSLGSLHITDLLFPHPTYPIADVLQWKLQDNSTIILRPSGTEPKLKIYLSLHRPTSTHTPASCQLELNRLADHVKAAISR